MPMQAEVRALLAELVSVALAGAALHDNGTPPMIALSQQGGGQAAEEHVSPVERAVEGLLVRIKRGLRQEQQLSNTTTFGRHFMYPDILHVLAVSPTSHLDMDSYTSPCTWSLAWDAAPSSSAPMHCHRELMSLITCKALAVVPQPLPACLHVPAHSAECGYGAGVCAGGPAAVCAPDAHGLPDGGGARGGELRRPLAQE